MVLDEMQEQLNFVQPHKKIPCTLTIATINKKDKSMIMDDWKLYKLGIIKKKGD